MKSFVMILATLMCGYVIFIVSLAEKPTHWGVKNCELSEISPDFTPKEKADCRIMRGQKK
jgi:hypothetical protein